MKIVIVDDSITNLVVLKCLCAGVAASQVVPFTDSEAACTYLFANAVDVIVVDYSMPKLNGIEFTSLVRSHPLHARTPVLMVTGQGDRDIRLRALQAGATEFLSKPLDAAEFKARVRNFLPVAPLTSTIEGERLAAAVGAA